MRGRRPRRATSSASPNRPSARIAAAEELATDVARALDGPSLRAPASLASRCAARLQREARDLVESEADAARASVAAERARLAQTASKESEICTRAFEALVLAHALPDTLDVTCVKLGGRVVRGDPRMSYAVRSRMDDGARHPCQPCARASAPDRSPRRAARGRGAGGGRVAEQGGPQSAAAARSPLPHGLSVHPSETAIRLRSAQDGTGPGFDILIQSEPSRIELRGSARAGAAADATHNVVGDDAAKLQALRDGLVAMAGELADHKKSLRKASLGGTPSRASRRRGCSSIYPREHRAHRARDREAIARARRARDQAPRR